MIMQKEVNRQLGICQCFQLKSTEKVIERGASNIKGEKEIVEVEDNEEPEVHVSVQCNKASIL